MSDAASRDMNLREYLDSRPLYKNHAAYKELDAMEAEITRLRAALERLGDSCWLTDEWRTGGSSSGGILLQELQARMEYARKALEDK